jgi:hypothetical protein
MNRLARRKLSALFRRPGDKWRRYVLTRLASALRATRLGALVFGEMFGVLEQMATLLATILVGRHLRFSNTNPPGSTGTTRSTVRYGTVKSSF